MMNILNHPELAGFYSLAAVAIFASLRVVTQANPVHAILSMIVSLLAIAGIFFVLGAPFAGALEIVVVCRRHYGAVCFCHHDAELRYEQ